MVILQKVCFCCQLQTGGVVFGWLYGCFAIIKLIFLTTLIHYGDVMPDDTKIVTIIFTTFTVLEIVATIIAIYGTAKKNHNLLIPWLIIIGIQLIPLLPLAIAIAIITFPIIFPFYTFQMVYSLFKTFRINDDNNNNGIPMATVIPNVMQNHNATI